MMTIAEKAQAIGDNEVGIYAAGRNDERDEFWENALKGTGWQDRFSGECWNDKTFRPTKDIKPKGSANYCFAQNGITDMVALLEECGVVLDTSGINVRGDALFNYNLSITTVPYLDLSNVTYQQGINNIFASCEKLKKVVGLRVRDDGTLTMSGAFGGCKSLEDIIIYGVIGQSVSVSAAKKLSKDSIISFMTHLSDTATGMKITFSQLAVDIAFQTNEGDGDGSTSVEWENLCATKPNWTIALA